MQFSSRRLFLAVLLVATGVFVVNSEFWREPRFRKGATRLYRAKVAAIEKELVNTTGEKWGGTYYARHDEQYEALSLGVTKDWVFEAVDLKHGVKDDYDRNFGEFRMSGDWVVLDPKFDRKKIPLRLLRVRLGARQYLIGDNQRDQFREAVQNGTEPRATRDGIFFYAEETNLNKGKGALIMLGSICFGSQRRNCESGELRGPILRNLRR